MKLFGVNWRGAPGLAGAARRAGSPTGRGALALLIATAAGLVIGYLSVPRSAPYDDPRAPPPEVRLLGQRLTLDDRAAERALEAVRQHVVGWFHLEVPGSDSRRYSFGRLGVAID